MSELGDSFEAFLRRIVREVVREELAAMKAAEPPPISGEQFLSLKHASAHLDIPVDTLKKWIYRGQITRYKIRGCVRVKLSELVTAYDPL